MHSNAFTFENLPDRLPIFPLPGVLLLPHGLLPLNIFEPRYIAMVDDAMANNRIIGMIQPKTPGANVYEVGCAGRIVNFAEAEGGRYLITLAGLARFRISEEVTTTKSYRTVQADWTHYRDDMANKGGAVAVDRARLNQLLKSYFRQQEMSCDWDKVDIAADVELLTALAMICPLKASEKQALLESPDVVQRTKLFMTMLEMAISHASENTDGGCCH